ncbi:BTAD domain-containing putative transcriptional regulator [Streptomyces sp. NRRL F-5123]|uniref:BTAD domain-containing putative transcriptional regulator n=1 Tax=Streptomyces sp. NRRL F-5123 TaxID=1463856 RepID=UPI000693A2AF|nr:BTAD domain-containing putative transcriptional regulator [Streptomyces sp. NRRL F-5123]
MRIGVLGPLRVTVDDRPVDVGGTRLRTLLALLALGAGRTVSVESLVTGLWPDGGPADPSHALQSLVSRLRRALGDARALLVAADGGYRLDVPPDAVDARRFERLAALGRRLLAEGDGRRAAEALREALGLWRGEALTGLTGTAPAAAAAARLAEARVDAVQARITAELQFAADHGEAVAELEALTARFPLREPLRVLLVRTLHTQGRAAEALSAFDAYRRLLADELGADPGPELRAAHLAVLRGTPAPRPVPPARPAGNLRAPLNRLVGRSAEVGQVTARLAQGRLVTLVGPGGVGKTRLAGAVAAGVADSAGGGVWLVELAPVARGRDLASAAAAALALRPPGPHGGPAADDPLGPLVEALRGGECLLVLDNCEHLPAEVAAFAEELLGRCPRLRVLATSREPLGLPGEMLCPVRPLELPEPGASAADSVALPAVQLFAERAAAARPGFAVREENVAAVVEVCRRLDGLPLSLELAAARLRTMPLEEVVRRLTDRFRLLDGGSRAAAARHRTLGAVVGWSWDLLTGQERWVAARLAVVPAAISLETAEGVCARGGMATAEVLGHVTALADKSLLQVVDGPVARYRMLETIREFALQRLAGSDESARARSDHAGYCLELAEGAADDLRGAAQPAWVARLSGEQASLLAALRHFVSEADAPRAVRLVAALGWLWTVQGAHAEAAQRLLEALRVPGDAPPGPRATAMALCLFNRLMSGGTVTPGPDRAQARSVAAGVPEAEAYPARALIEVTLALWDDDVHSGLWAADRDLPGCGPWARGMLLMMRGFLRGNHGEVAGMREDLAAAVGAFRVSGERWAAALALTALADADAVLGDFDAVIGELTSAIGLLRELDPENPAISQRAALATARVRRGDVERARAELTAMLRPLPGAAPARELFYARVALGNLHRARGDLGEAAGEYRAAVQELDRDASAPVLLRAVLGAALAHQAMAEGDPERAFRHAAESFRLAGSVPDMPVVAQASVAAARLHLDLGRPDAAAEIVGAADVLRGAPDTHNPDVARVVAQTVAALDERGHAELYRRGRALDRAAAHALVASYLADTGRGGGRQSPCMPAMSYGSVTPS